MSTKFHNIGCTIHPIARPMEFRTQMKGGVIKVNYSPTLTAHSPNVLWQVLLRLPMNTGTLTTVLKDNLIMETTSDFSSVKITAESIIEPLGDCRFRIDGETYQFAIRKLTPRECFRLMGVSEGVIDKIQAAGISNAQQYKMAGNSIVTDCLYHIFRKIYCEPGFEQPTQLSLF